jgi:hypothetical protein
MAASQDLIASKKSYEIIILIADRPATALWFSGVYASARAFLHVFVFYPFWS